MHVQQLLLDQSCEHAEPCESNVSATHLSLSSERAATSSCAQVAKGQADAAMLAKEKQRLGQMQQQLDTLEVEKAKTANRASSLLSFLGIGGSKQQKQQQQPEEQQQPEQRPKAGSGWQSLLGKARGSQQQQQAAVPTANAPAASSSGSGSPSNALLQAWESLGQQLLRLEGQLNEQQSRTERQRVSVQRLQQKVRAVLAGCLCALCRRQGLCAQGVKCNFPNIYCHICMCAVCLLSALASACRNKHMPDM